MDDVTVNSNPRWTTTVTFSHTFYIEQHQHIHIQFTVVGGTAEMYITYNNTYYLRIAVHFVCNFQCHMLHAT